MISLQEAVASGRGLERPFTCPAHDNKSITASINIMKGVWYCYSCHAHGWLEDHVPTVDEALAIMAGEEAPRIYPEEWLDIFDADHSSFYWVRRVGIEVASANRCGTDLITGSPTYPVRDDAGRVLGVVSRHENADPKYLYPYGISTSRTLFGPLRPCEVLVLVEGASDVMSLQQAGLPDGWNAVGCYGAGLHYPQVAIVAAMSPKVVIAAFDDDEAGRGATERSRQVLDDLVPVLSHPWLSVGGKDPGEVAVQDRIPSLERTLNAQPHGRNTP